MRFGEDLTIPYHCDRIIHHFKRSTLPNKKVSKPRNCTKYEANELKKQPNSEFCSSEWSSILITKKHRKELTAATTGGAFSSSNIWRETPMNWFHAATLCVYTRTQIFKLSKNWLFDQFYTKSRGLAYSMFVSSVICKAIRGMKKKSSLTTCFQILVCFLWGHRCSW